MKSLLAQSVFSERRARLMAQMQPHSIAIVPSAQMAPRNRDVDYAFRQDSDFYYLTGFDEPDAVLVLIPGRESGECVVFCQDRDPEMEIWHGYRAGPEGLKSEYGADQAHPIGLIDDQMPGLLDGCDRIYYAIGCDDALDAQVRGWLNAIRAQARQGAVPPTEMVMLD
ncbi:MAG: aminopeptidase P N-terminal domain-containing protein, partial [Oceanospirillaceae bacterium]|nr:aminopeptidase P N-terminal domain-containing protein [Oceanospirillaceae bacterium]